MSDGMWLHDDIKQHRDANQRLRYIFWIVVGVAAVALTIALTSFNSHAQHNKQVAALAKEKSSLETNYKQYLALNQKASTLPSTTTKTKDEWDTYYDDIASQVQTIQSSVNGTTYNQPTLITLNSDLATALNDSLNFYALGKSVSDMSFQIQTDMNAISNDNSQITIQSGLANNGCNIGICDYSYVTTAKTKLNTDKSQLAKDQDTLNEQQKQSIELANTIKIDNNKLNNDAFNL